MGRTRGSTIEALSIINGDISENANISPPKLGIITREFVIPLSQGRQASGASALQLLPNTPTGTHLGFDLGTWGTNAPKLTTGDVKVSSTNRYGLWEINLPYHYEDALPVTLRVSSRMNTTQADTSANVDCVAYLADEEGGIEGTDVCQTEAADMNTTDVTTTDFVLNPTNMEKAGTIWARVGIEVVDGSTGTAVIGQLLNMKLICHCRG